MPTLYTLPIGFTLGTQNDNWNYCYFPEEIPDNASALLLRVAGPTQSGATAYVMVTEFYGDSEAYLDTIWLEGRKFLNQSGAWDLLVAYRGPGSIVSRVLLNSAYPVSGYILGYFVEEEFVAFTDRKTFTFDTGGSLVDFDITGEDWYINDAEAYLTGSCTGTGYIAPKGWKSRNAANMDERTSVFWPDTGGEIWAQYSNTFTIPGYFTGRMNKGTHPGGRKVFAAHHRPIGDPQEFTWLTAHQADPTITFAIAEVEYSNFILDWPRMVTRIGGGVAPGIITGYGGNFFNGRYWGGELFVYPSREEGSEGEVDVYCQDYRFYNTDGFIELCSFPDTVVITGDRGVDFEDVELGEPSIIQSSSPTMAVPLLYNTYPGEYTWNGTLSLYLSGGSSNADPSLSLGGAKSVTAAGSNLFGPITNRKAQLGGAEYRCFYLHNSSGSETAYGLALWVHIQAKYGNSIQIGLDPSGVDGSVQLIATEDDSPVGVEFYQPSGEVNALQVPVLGPGRHIGVWVRRAVDVQNPFSGAEIVTLAFSVMNNG